MMVKYFKYIQVSLILTTEEVLESLHTQLENARSNVLCVASKPLQTSNFGCELHVRRSYVLYLVHALFIDELLKEYPQLVCLFY